MFIQTEETPNPNALKFLLGRTVLEDGGAEFNSPLDAQNCELASLLFKIKYVALVFLGVDFITVTKHDVVEWEVIKPEILTVISEYFAQHQSVELLEQLKAENSVDHEEFDSGIVGQIQDLIYSKIKPAVMQDGGDVEFKKYKDGVVFLQLKGACSGCPSAAITLKDGIEGMLQHYIPEVKAVEAIDE